MKKSKSELPLIGTKTIKKNEKKKIINNIKKVKPKMKLNTQEEIIKNNNIIIPPLKQIHKTEQKSKKIENLIEECGIPMAFNVIFSELISKQIMPENFFTYTSLRLKELGREIEGLKVKEPVYIERLEKVVVKKRLKSEGDKIIKPSNVFMTVQQKRKKSSIITNRSNDNEKNN